MSKLTMQRYYVSKWENDIINNLARCYFFLRMLIRIYRPWVLSGLFNADLLVGRVPGSGWNELIPSATIV